jgi:hypothetical protein
MGDVAMIASARMYSWSPSLLAAWQRLLQWGERSTRGSTCSTCRRTRVVDDSGRAPTWPACLCGYPWALRESRPHLRCRAGAVAATLRRTADYVSDFIVRADSGLGIWHTFGGTIADSTEHSHSG